MNKLFIRLILAMMLVSIISLAVVPIAQGIATQRTLDDLPDDFRQLIEDRTQPVGVRLGPPPGRRGRYDDRHPLNETLLNSDNARNPNPLNPPPPKTLRDPPPTPPVDPPLLEVINDPALINNLSAVAALEANNGFEGFENLGEQMLTLFRDYRLAQSQAIIFGFIAAIALCIFLAWWLAKAIAKPIEAVTFAASHIAKGDLSSRVDTHRLKRHPQESQDLAKHFNAMAESLENYEGERKAMIADIAHELRNPLATMQFRLEALSDGIIEFNEEEGKLLQGQVSLLSRLISDLRTLSLADAGQLSLYKTPMDLYGLVKNLLSGYEERAQRQGVVLSFDSQLQDEALYVEADADRMAQVIHNLLDNAFKLVAEGGYVGSS
ncbi:MAG: histidine kinase dimerization/phospho-acceptor domain-containing protein [Deinococcales bacterium]